MGMDPVMESHDRLIEWMGDAADRQAVAAAAEQHVRSTYQGVETGSEQFYSLVLERALAGK